MKYGTYPAAFIKYVDEDGLQPTNRVLKHVNMVIHDNGFAEIIHYEDGIKDPNNKRVMVIPASSLIIFIGYGYAN